MALNYLCANDVSDEDCRKCAYPVHVQKLRKPLMIGKN